MTKPALILLVLSLLVPACDGDDGGGGNYLPPPGGGGGDNASGGDNAGGDGMTPGDGWAGGPLAAADLCDEVARVMCNAEPNCCTDAGRRYPNVAACIGAETASCEADVEPIAIDARTGYNPTTGGQKLLELQALASSCDPSAGVWLLSDDGLFAALDGTVASGGDCTPATIFPAVDYAALLSCTGGEACLVTIAVGISAACGARGGAGAGCFTDSECQPDFWCDPPFDIMGGGGNCFARGTNGQACTDNAGCLSLSCNGVCGDPAANDAYCLN